MVWNPMFHGLVGISLVAAGSVEDFDTTSLLQTQQQHKVARRGGGAKQELEVDPSQDLELLSQEIQSTDECEPCTCSDPHLFGQMKEWKFNGCNIGCGAKCGDECCCLPGVGKCASKEEAKKKAAQKAAAKAAAKEAKAAAEKLAAELEAAAEVAAAKVAADIKRTTEKWAKAADKLFNPDGCPVCTCSEPHLWGHLKDWKFNGCSASCGAKCGDECCCVAGVGTCPKLDPEKEAEKDEAEEKEAADKAEAERLAKEAKEAADKVVEEAADKVVKAFKRAGKKGKVAVEKLFNPHGCPVCKCSNPWKFLQFWKWKFNGCSASCGAKCGDECCCIGGFGNCPKIDHKKLHVHNWK